MRSLVIIRRSRKRYQRQEKGPEMHKPQEVSLRVLCQSCALNPRRSTNCCANKSPQKVNIPIEGMELNLFIPEDMIGAAIGYAVKIPIL